MTQVVTVSALGGLGACAGADDRQVALLEALLARHDSATLALEDWCRGQGIADPRVVAQVIHGNSAEPQGLREQLGVHIDEALRLRQVRLTCGKLTLSRASNWYVPSRLTPQMNAALESTTSPFGKIAAPLRFRREMIESRRGTAPDCPQDTKLFQRALLRLPGGQPLALVAECYLLGG
jgi:chorismate-pyruvate lyase